MLQAVLSLAVKARGKSGQHRATTPPNRWGYYGNIIVQRVSQRITALFFTEPGKGENAGNKSCVLIGKPIAKDKPCGLKDQIYRHVVLLCCKQLKAARLMPGGRSLELDSNVKSR